MTVAATHEALVAPFRQLLTRIHGAPELRLESIHEQPRPHQGASGAAVRLYRVRWRSAAGVQGEERLVCKHASLKERQVVRLLDAQSHALPPSLSPMPASPAPARALLIMQYARRRPLHLTLGDPNVPLTQQVAQGLARIHAANLEGCPDWLPRAADDPMGRLYLQATQDEWARCMADARFRSNYGHYDRPLRESLRQLLDLLAELEAESSCCTLLNSDLHPDHIRLLHERPVFIDWEQACYGPLYLDLVNYFTLETALLYRDALAAAGHAIAPAAFMQRFRAVGHFMGLRYLEVGLLSWQSGGAAWQQGRWFFHYCLSMALSGR